MKFHPINGQVSFKSNKLGVFRWKAPFRYAPCYVNMLAIVSNTTNMAQVRGECWYVNIKAIAAQECHDNATMPPFRRLQYSLQGIQHTLNIQQPSGHLMAIN